MPIDLDARQRPKCEPIMTGREARARAEAAGWTPQRLQLRVHHGQSVASWATWCIDITPTGLMVEKLVCLSCGCTIERGKTYSKNPPPLPVRRDVRSGRCEACGRAGTQAHHSAPSHLFADADWWPMFDLCQPCHSDWHKKMTPANKCPEGGPFSVRGPRDESFDRWVANGRGLLVEAWWFIVREEAPRQVGACERCRSANDVAPRQMGPWCMAELCAGCWETWSSVIDAARLLVAA